MAGQSADILLNVGFDLAFFRNQLPTLGTAAAGYRLPIQVKFDRTSITSELDNLQRAIKRRTYRIEIGGNLDGLPDKIKTLKEQLASLEAFKVDLGIGAVKSLSKKDASKIRSDLQAEILGEQKKIFVPVSIKPKINRDDVRDFKNAVKSKLAGLSVDVKVNAKGGGFAGSAQGAAGLMEYMRSQGMVGKTASGMEMRLGKGGDDIKQQLSDAVGSAEKIKSIFDGIAKNIATTGKSSANVQGKRLVLENVPLVARSVEKKVERSTSAIEGTTSSSALKALYPEINRAITSFVALRGQIQQNTSKLSGFSLIIGLAAFAGVPLAKSIVKLTGSANNFARLLDNLGLKLESAVIKAASNILGASSGRLLSGTSLAGLLPPAASPAGLLPPAYRGIGPAAGPAGLLPPAYRGIGPSAEPAGLLPSLSSAGRSNAIIEALIASTGPRLLPSGGGDDTLGKLALRPGQLKERVDAILRDYFKVVEIQVREVFSAPPIKKESLNIFDYLDTEQYFNYLAQARVNVENAMQQRIEEAKQVTKQNKIKDAAQSFLRALEETVRSAERSAFAQSRIAANQSYVQRANIREIGQPLLGGKQVTPPKMLSAATGFYRGAATPPETQAQLFARREREARVRSALRGVAPPAHFTERPRLPGTKFMGDDFTRGGGRDRVRGVGQPPERGGALALAGGPSTRLPEGYFENVRKYNAALAMAQATAAKFTASQIPLVGALREVAGEFGVALKQVILYGVAYKGLAFITSLPGQVLNAAKSQQQFNNALQTATQDTGTFAKELLYVDNVQRAFGLNLETTRTGFVRLYASMAPTGFDSGSIEKLFTGISAATAALQLTPDKAERVIYAFGQMASKGQIMSEELKGQLGDVLPGALAIFAKAAGMSVKDFSKAMEDGVFVGGKFREVFAKVSDELMNRFGTGAQAAGRSLQGLLNTVGGDFQRTLESFAPLANAAAQAVLGPLGGALREISTAAQIAMGEQDRVAKQLQTAQKDVSDLKVGGADAKSIKAAEQNVAALTARYEALNAAAKDPAIAQQVKNIEAFLTEVQKAATFTMNLAGMIGKILSPALNFLGGNLTTVISLITTFYIGFQTARLAAMALMGALLLYRGLSTLLGFGAAAQQATALAGAFNVLGVSATRANVALVGTRAAMTALVSSTVVGAVIAGLLAIASAFATMGNSAKAAADKAKRSIDSMADAARTGNVAVIEMELAVNKEDRQDLENFIKTVESLKGKKSARGVELITLTPAQKREAKRLGVEVAGEIGKGALLGSLKELRAPLKQAATEGQEDLIVARQRAAKLGQNQPTPGTFPPDTPDTKDADRAADRAAENARKLEDDKRKYESDLMKLNFQQALNLSDMEFEHWKTLQQEKYNILIAGENSWLAQALKFQQQLQNVEINRIEAVRRARQSAAKAEVEAGAKSYMAGVGNGPGGGAIFGDTGRTFNAKGWVHGHFQNMNRAALIEDTVDVVMKLLEQGVKPELSSGAAFSKGMSREQVTGLVKRGIESHKRYASGISAIDVFVPQGTPVPTPLSGVGDLGGAAGVTGSLARGTQLMHLDPRSKGGAAQSNLPASRVRAEAKKDYNAALAAQTALNEKEQEGVVIKYESIEAQMQIAALIKEQVALITPVKEQKLENQLLGQKINLLSSGVFGERLDTEMKIAEATAKANIQIGLAREKIEENNQAAKEGKYTNQEVAALNATQLEIIEKQEKALADYLPLLREKLNLEQQIAFTMNMEGLRKQLELASIIDPQKALRARIRQENPEFSTGQVEEQALMEERVARMRNVQEQMQGIASSIGDSFGNAFKGIITGSMTAQEALAGMFQSIADHFADMVAKMIAEWIKMMILKGIEAIINPMAGLGNLNPTSPGGDWMSAVDRMNATSAYADGGIAPGGFTAFANGGIAPGGFTAFANGGMVTGPTMGLVGEGRYNEAIVPLPDGKSIPVELSGGGSAAPTVIVNVDAKGTKTEGNEQNANQLGRVISAAVQSELIKQQRPGGLLASR